ncbi:uncharacterized protein ACOB6Z_001517 [Ctenodactylus gundi]
MGLLAGDALMSVAMAVAVFLLLVDLMHRRQRWAARYPPGPVPLPGLGNLLQVDFYNLPYSFFKLRYRFGDVFSLQLAWTPVVVLNGLTAMREVLVTHSEDTSDRPQMPIFEHLGSKPKSPGVIMAPYGSMWREQRRFSVSTLRNFGLGKKSLEQWVTEEATHLCAAFADQAGRPFSPGTLLNKAVCNVIASLIYARRFEYNDALLARMLDLQDDIQKEQIGLVPQMLNAVPILLRIPGLPGKVFPGMTAYMGILDELLTEHRKTWDPAQSPRDLTDSFLVEMEKAKGNPGSSFNDENLRMVVSDLFTAGMVTTSTTLAWALLLMILHPDVQRRVQQEINDVIGQARHPEMGDQARMPFTNAVIHEVQRFADIAPMGVPHMTSRDVEVQGFLIPKGTVFFTNLSSVLKDETVWEKPFQFHPGHFLDSEGRFVKPEAFMPFSAGRRACLGEPLARMELFLFFTCLLQHFSFAVPEGQPRPSDFGVVGGLSMPPPYELCAVAILVGLMHWRQCWAARYPPGPLPLPRLDNLLQVDFHNSLFPFFKAKEWQCFQLVELQDRKSQIPWLRLLRAFVLLYNIEGERSSSQIRSSLNLSAVFSILQTTRICNRLSPARSPVDSSTAMGLLTGDALLPVAVAVAVFLLLADLMHRRQRWVARYPPGPLPLPGLGNLLQLDFQNLPYSFFKLRSRFGDVFSLQLAWRPVVVLNGLTAVREALVTRNEDTADRPPMPIYEHVGLRPQSQGVVLAAYGPAWREQRRFSMSTLRNFGLGKKSLEQWVAEEGSCLCAAFADHNGHPFSPNILLKKAVCNAIASLIYARRFEYNDPLLIRILDLLEEDLKDESGFVFELMNAVPMLLRIPGVAGKALPALKALLALLDGLATEHRMTRDPAQPPRDLTDSFLEEVEKAKGNPSSSFSDENLRMVVSDLFIAGMITTSTTLAWALLLMILHPDVQRRVQQEIDDVIGQARHPEMGDQAHMPLTNAVIHEVQRFADIIPLSLPHMTTRDIEVQGFLIPKGTTLITNLSSVLKDETVWEKPFQFHPGHFLDSEGRFVKPEAFMPFSAGRRACLGEPLARMELFLFFTCLLQRFSFAVPEGQPRPSDFGVLDLLTSPAPYQLCAVVR